FLSRSHAAICEPLSFPTRRSSDLEGERSGYFTMDARMSRAVIEVFVRLHEQGLIYRGKRLVNWDPELGTAVSDLEVDSEEENGKDRKSTRLNSSHGSISYAVLCLK